MHNSDQKCHVVQSCLTRTITRLRNISGSLLTLALLALSFQSAGSQAPADDVDQLYRLSGGRLAPEGAQYMRNNWINHQEPCEKVSDVGGWNWAVMYRDGFTVFNCFRKCRGTYETASYFLGLSEGDCDSWYYDAEKNEHSVCFPRDASQLVRAHGAVVAVMRIDRVGACYR